jgi:hypothetical protein
LFNHVLITDGYALLSKFEIKGNSVKFTKKYLQSDAYLKATLAERPLITEFGTKAYPNPSNKGLFCRLISSLVGVHFNFVKFLSKFDYFNQNLIILIKI